MGGADRRRDLVGVGVLQQVSRRAGLEGPLHEFRLAERGERHHLDVVVPGSHPPGRFDPVDRSHLQVHENHVWANALGIEPCEQVEHLGASLGRPNDLEVVFSLEESE